MVRSMTNTSLCWSIDTDLDVDNILKLKNITTIATSSAESEQHIPKRAIDGNPESFWRSIDNIEDVTYTVLFPEI